MASPQSAASASPSSAQRRSSNPVAPFPLGSSSEDEPPAMVIQDPGDESYEITRAMPTYRQQKRGSRVLDALLVQEDQTRCLERRLAPRSEARLKAHADLDPAPLPAAARVEATALPLERALFADGDEDRARRRRPARAGRVRRTPGARAVELLEQGREPQVAGAPAAVAAAAPVRGARAVARADVPRDEPAPRRRGAPRGPRGLLRPPLRPRPKGETRARSRSARPRDDLADRLDTAVSELARERRRGAERDGELAEIRAELEALRVAKRNAAAVAAEAVEARGASPRSYIRRGDRSTPDD
ncbi:hypothetical protein JL722_5612 [Aureococcus anophagefferens]|nr:hypothetical protein JL722_5612 [Aureococcus anophagefferens]